MVASSMSESECETTRDGGSRVIRLPHLLAVFTIGLFALYSLECLEAQLDHVVLISEHG